MEKVIKSTSILVNIALLSTLLACLSCGPKKDDSKKEAIKENAETFDDKKIKVDTEFAVNAAEGGMLEVKLGELSQTHAASPAVKAFGKMMIDEHSKFNENLKALAAVKGITLPADLGKKCQKDYDELAQKSGREFDEAYLAFMVRDHREDIEEMRKEAEQGVDPELKLFAGQLFGFMQNHLEKALETQKAIGVKSPI
jgi:putative membrane protein